MKKNIIYISTLRYLRLYFFHYLLDNRKRGDIQSLNLRKKKRINLFKKTIWCFL